MGEPLPAAQAWRDVAACVLRSIGMLTHRRLRQPRADVGRVIAFADGTSARVFRETVVVDAAPREPCTLAVSFRLRLVRGPVHRIFQRISVLNTPLFVGFPGFVAKLWLADDEFGVYRGLYEWDGPAAAERYARSLWRVLALVSERGSIDYRVIPGVRRDAVLATPALLDPIEPEHRDQWWRVAAS